MTLPEIPAESGSSPAHVATRGGERPNIVRRMYDWTLAQSRTKYAVPVLAATAFTESSFFLVPPDLLILAMGTAQPKRSFYYAGVSTVMSALGGVFGYFLGYWFWDALSGYFFRIPGFTPELFERVSGMYNENGAVIVLLAGFTPIPYKVFTIASGVVQMNLPVFFLASLASRGARYFILGGITYWFGEKVQTIMDRHFNRIVWGGGAAMVALYFLYKMLKG
ncbi:MAG: DedA family protein [Deltaproteobacteria bacterium]|nr:DedA family protein [Deltaproteobacteria bacterium]